MKKNSQKLTIGILFVLAAATIFWIARPASDVAEPVVAGTGTGSGRLSATEASYDFGKVSMSAGKVSHDFTIKNSGSGSLVIEKLYTSCMCTSASLVLRGDKIGPFGMPGHGFVPGIRETMGPGEEAGVGVVFDPAAHGPAGVGRIERVVYLENNAGSPLQLKISATVTP